MTRLLLTLLLFCWPGPLLASAQPYLFALADQEPTPEPASGGFFVEFVADNGALNFTPPDVGTGLWSQTGKPTAATLNTSTGNLSGTMTVEGTYDIELTRASGEKVRVRLLIHTSTVTINSAWLANATNQITVFGETAYVCKTRYCLYTLDTDVNVDGAGFYLANVDIGFDGDGHTITFQNAGIESGADGGNSSALLNESHLSPHGVVLYDADQNDEVTISGGASEVWDIAIVNLNIVNADPTNLNHGIYGWQVINCAFQNCQITTAGIDSGTIVGMWTDYVWIADCILTADMGTDTYNRHNGPANVFCSTGSVFATHNLILGGNSAFNISTDSIITENIIAHEGYFTNNYAVFLYRNNDVQITNNLMLPRNGRGILWNAGEDHIASGNVILHWEVPNGEFGHSLNAPAVRARYDTINLHFHDNTTLGIGGGSESNAAEWTSASGLYISNYNGEQSIYEDNNCTTILRETPGFQHYAQPISLEGTGSISGSGAPGTDLIQNNTFRSNHYLLRMEGYDNWARQDEPLTDNSFDWVTGETAYEDFMDAVNTLYATFSLTSAVETAADAYIATIDGLIDAAISGEGLQSTRAAWYVGDASSHDGVLAYCDVLDSTWGGSVDNDSYDHFTANAGSRRFREGFTQQVQLLDGASPLANTDVTVTTAQGDSYDITTNGTGHATFTFYRFGIEKANGGSYSVINRTASTLTPDGYGPEVITHASVPATLDFDPT